MSDRDNRRHGMIGKPPLRIAEPLRTMAWLQFLIRDFPKMVERTEKPEWVTTRDRNALATFVRNQKLTTGSLRALDRTYGEAIENQDWLLRKVGQLQASLTPPVLMRVEALAEGSTDAYHIPPAPFDPWLYDALEYRNVWKGKLFVWRLLDDDSLFEDATPKTDPHTGQWTPEVREQMDRGRWISDADEQHLSRLVHLALLRVFVSEHRFEESDELIAWLCARVRSEAGGASGWLDAHLKQSTLTDELAFHTWTTLLGLLRMCQLGPLPGALPAAIWAYRGAVRGIEKRLEHAELLAFHLLPGPRPALSDLLRRMNLWTNTEIPLSTDFLDREDWDDEPPED